jgi:pyrimidine-specific ribonucleoside hydrolase
MRRLVFLAAVSIVLEVVAGTRAEAAARPVWIDTDPICTGTGRSDDIDDCWALLYALASPELAVRGISTVFGNAEGPSAYENAKDLIARFATARGRPAPPIYAGASVAIGTTSTLSPGAAALGEALAAEPLTILALGPLTNLAQMLRVKPELAKRIVRVVAVAGTRVGQTMLFPGSNRIVHLHDFNFKKDPKAFSSVLDREIEVVLTPFEAAQTMTMTRADLGRVAKAGPVGAYLAEISRNWLGFWEQEFKAPGFHPFDVLAVAYAVDPGALACASMTARVLFQQSLIVPRTSLEVADKGPGRRVTYCTAVAPAFKEHLVERLRAG